MRISVTTFLLADRRSEWQTSLVLRSGLNRAQKIVVVVGLGFGLCFLGLWLTSLDHPTGWVAFAPMTDTDVGAVGGLHPWLQLLIWLALVAVWIAMSVNLLQDSPSDTDD